MGELVTVLTNSESVCSGLGTVAGSEKWGPCWGSPCRHGGASSSGGGPQQHPKARKGSGKGPSQYWDTPSSLLPSSLCILPSSLPLTSVKSEKRKKEFLKCRTEVWALFFCLLPF